MLNSIFTLFESIIAEQPYALILNVVFAIAVAVFAFNIVKYLQEHQVFRKILAKLKSDLKEQERLREEEYKKQLEQEGQFVSKSKMQRLNKKLIKSGIQMSHPEITAEIFTLIIVATCVIVAFVLYFTENKLMTIIIGTAITVFLWMFTLEVLIARNQTSLEKETIKFVNLLKNFSHTEGSIAEMLGRTIPYISNPLKASVERCYYEIKTTGDTSLALQRLYDRTSYKKLQEVFDALRVCSTHNEDYEQVIDESYRNVDSYIASRKELKQIKISNIIDILVMGAMGIVVIFEMQSMLVDIDVNYYLFETLLGQAGLTAMGVILAYSIYNVIRDEEK